ncbi:MAG: exo-alpha-sialidase [Bacillota bacterium]
MNSKIFSKLDTTKKKAGAVVLCIVLVAALGAGTVFAARSMSFLQVRMENGVRTYSTDGGRTWSQDAPDGVTVSEEDGKITITNSVFPKGGEGTGMLIKTEDGVRYYSVDGGKSWRQTAPEGVIVDEDGPVFIKVKND